MRRTSAALLLLALTMSACGSSTAGTSTPLGQPFAATATSATRASAPAGDPPGEHNGTLSPAQAPAPAPLSAVAAARSPQAAIRRYALAYTNWNARTLPAHERALASLVVGPARLADEQTATSQSRAKELATNDVRNKGVVLAITPGQGPAHGLWVIVTLEQTTGTGPYVGLPASPYVTLARTIQLGHRWAVSEWDPRT